MPMEKEKFLKKFAKEALDERISLFLGAGGSCDAGYPTWSGLFEPLAKELNTNIDDSTDYYLLAQYYANTFGRAELKKKINDYINRNKFESPLLSELMEVGFTNIWTTNFDNAIELNYQKRNILINKIFKDADLYNVELNKRINIFKLNGDITNLGGVIATQSDYEKYIDTHYVMSMFFKRELISNTFLFIGYSFTDHLVLDCLSELARYLGEATNCHYTIIKREPKNQYFNYFIDDLEKRYNLKVLLVNEYEEIPEILAELNQKIRNQRVFISGSFGSYETNIEQYSHALAKSLAFSLLENNYRIVNGIGRRFGTHLIGYANEYLAKKGVKDIEKHLIVRPFVGKGENAMAEKQYLREEVIGKCGSAIFVFGDRIPNTKSGVLEEFNIACKQHKTIIPIAYPNMISDEIWKKVKQNITSYPYLEKSIDKLSSDEPIESVTKKIIYILNSIQDNK